MGDATGRGVDIVIAIDAGGSDGVAIPSVEIASRVGNHAGGVDSDGEVKGVDGVASDHGVAHGVSVGAGGAVGLTIPRIVTAVGNVLRDIEGIDNVEGKSVDVSTGGEVGVVDSVSVVIGARLGVGVTMPNEATAGVFGAVDNLSGWDGNQSHEEAVASTEGTVGQNGVAIEAGVVIDMASPIVGATVAGEGLVGGEHMVHGEVQHKESVAVIAKLGGDSAGGVGLAIDAPSVGLTGGDIGTDNHKGRIVLSQGKRHERCHHQ